MAIFNFCFIVEILEETSQKLSFKVGDFVSLTSLLSAVDGDMAAADEKCNELMKTLHSKYFPELKIEMDGTGYNVSDRVRENFYIATFTDPISAKSFLEKLDKILYDFRDSDQIRINGNTAYINRVFFAKKVADFGHELVAYDLLKNLDL